MTVLKGLKVCDGTCSGRIFVYSGKSLLIKRTHIGSSDDEIIRFFDARESALADVDMFLKKSSDKNFPQAAYSFELQKSVIENERFGCMVEDLITDQMIDAQTATAQVCDELVQMLESVETKSEAQKIRAVRCASERIIRSLAGEKIDELFPKAPCILLCRELHADELIQLDDSVIMGIASCESSPFMTEFAKRAGIPFVTGMNSCDARFNGKAAVLDGDTGELRIN